MKYLSGRFFHVLIASTLVATGVPASERPLVPDALGAVSGNANQTPRPTRPELVLQTGVSVPVAALAYSPDGKLLASMSFQGGAIKLWEVATGRELTSLNLGSRSATTSAINSAFVFTQDGRTLVSFSSGSLKEWDTATGREAKSVVVNNTTDVAGASFSDDGKYLATLTQTKSSLSVRNVSTGRAIHKLDFDAATSNQFINAFALSPDGKLVATAEESRGADGDKTNLVLRDTASARILRTIKLTEENVRRGIPTGPLKSVQPIRAVRFSQDGQSLAIAIRDLTYEQAPGSIETRAIAQANTVKVFDVATGRESRSFDVPGAANAMTSLEMGEFLAGRGLTFTPDSRLIAAVANDPAVRIFDLAAGRESLPLSSATGHSAPVVAVAFSPDGKRAATAGLDSTIRLWNLSGGSNQSPVLIETLGGSATPVSGLSHSGDGRTLAVSGRQSVNLWEFGTGASIRTVDLPSRQSNRVEDLMHQRGQVVFSQGAQLVAAQTTEGETKVWETRTGREIRSLKLKSRKSLGTGAMSSDGKVLALPDEFSASTAPQASRSAGQAGAPPVPSMPFPMPGQSSGTTTKDAGQKDDRKKKDDRKDLEKQQREALKQMEKMSKSGQMPAGLGDLSQMQKIMEAAQSGDLAKIQDAMGQVVSSMPAGMIAAGRPAIGVKLFDVTSGSEIGSVPPPAQSFSMVDRSSIALSADSRLVASVTGRHIRVHEVGGGKELFSITPARAMSVDQIALNSNGRVLAASVMETKPGVNINQINSDFSFGDFFDFAVKLWDISDVTGARELRSLSGHTGSIGVLAFSQNGEIMATGGYDATIKLWDVASGRHLRDLNGHNLAITALQFSADSKHLVSGSDDGSARLWQADSGEMLATLVILNNGADWLVVTPDGLFDGTPAAWNQILWRFSSNLFDVNPVEVFFNEFYYPGLLTALSSGTRPRAVSDVSQRDRRQPIVKLSLLDTQSGAASTRTIGVRVEVSNPQDIRTGETAPGASDLRLFRNGTLVKVWRGDVLRGQASVALEATLHIVAGENRLTAYAFNRDNVKSLDATLVVTGASDLKRKGTAYILAFGVNRYANEQYNLKYAVPDASSFAEELRAQQAKLGQYEKIEVISLLDADVTKENMLLALRGLAGSNKAPLPPKLAAIRQTQPEDAVIIYFAGHGTAKGARFYLVPHDLGYTGSRTAVNAAAIETILAHSVSDLELESAIEGLDAERLLLVIDACNSGQALEAEEKRRGPMNSKGLAQLAYEKGIYILTAAQSYQAALEAAELGHGYLTYALVEEGLKRGLADREVKDGQILGREWFNYATERVPQMQEKGMLASRLLLFVEGEEGIKDPTKRSVQRPRVFYRRDLEAKPLVVARP